MQGGKRNGPDHCRVLLCGLSQFITNGARKMSDSKELWERIQEIEEQVEKDPKMIELKEKLERELGSLSQEDLDRVMRSSKPKVNKR